VTVYCYDLVPTRKKGGWTRAQDDVLRREYFPGLDPMMLVEPLRKAGMRGGGCYLPQMIINRLSVLGLRRRR
jgi:hypothetical protein